MRTTTVIVVGIALGVIAGCTRLDSDLDRQGNDALGIARFTISDSANKTTIVGLDAAGKTVGRLELVHGRYAVSPAFADDYTLGTIEAVGRQLDVDVLGQRLIWETQGWEPTLSLPGHPSTQWALALFLEDAHVKPVLARWQIGFLAGETPYFGENAGFDPVECTGTTCGSVRGLTINTCGSGSSPTDAWRITHWSAPGPIGDWYKIAQCCPPQSGILGGNVPWFGVKTCPFSGTTSECGTSSAACKACPIYPVVGYSCDVWVNDQVAIPEGKEGAWTHGLEWTYDAAFCGDQICMEGETCQGTGYGDCELDCGICVGACGGPCGNHGECDPGGSCGGNGTCLCI